MFDDPFDLLADPEDNAGPPPLLVPAPLPVQDRTPDQTGDLSFERERVAKYERLIFDFLRVYGDFHRTRREDLRARIEDLYDGVRGLAPYLGVALFAVPDLLC